MNGIFFMLIYSDIGKITNDCLILRRVRRFIINLRSSKNFYNDIFETGLDKVVLPVAVAAFASVVENQMMGSSGVELTD